jgi:hypothetical protein
MKELKMWRLYSKGNWGQRRLNNLPVVPQVPEAEIETRHPDSWPKANLVLFLQKRLLGSLVWEGPAHFHPIPRHLPQGAALQKDPTFRSRSGKSSQTQFTKSWRWAWYMTGDGFSWVVPPVLRPRGKTTESPFSPRTGLLLWFATQGKSYSGDYSSRPRGQHTSLSSVGPGVWRAEHSLCCSGRECWPYKRSDYRLTECSSDRVPGCKP